MHAFLCHGTRNLLNLLLAFVCNLEATFGAFESKKLDRLDTEEGFLEFEKDIVLDTAADDEDNFIVQVMVIMGENQEIVDDDDHPIEEIFKNVDHCLVESETGNGDAFLHEG